MYQIKQPISISTYVLSLWYASCALFLLVAYGTYDPLHNVCIYEVSFGGHDLYEYFFYAINSLIALLWYSFGSAGICWVAIFFWLSYSTAAKSWRVVDVPRCVAWGVLLVCWSTIAAWYNVDMGYAFIPGGLCGTYLCWLLQQLFDPFIGMGGVLVCCWAALLVLLGNRGIMFLSAHVYVATHLCYRAWCWIGAHGYEKITHLLYMLYWGLRNYLLSCIDACTFVHAGVMVPDGDHEYQALVEWLVTQRLQESEQFILKGATVSSVNNIDLNKEQRGVVSASEMHNNQELLDDNLPYQLPPIALLKSGMGDKQHSAGVLKKELQNKVALLEEKLLCFGVKGKVVKVTVGPVVAVIEYQPEIEIKISKIIALEDDLALALQAHSIRIIAPIPGKAVVGFEIAHESRQAVKLADAMHAPEYSGFVGALPLILGQDTIGEQVVVDLARMPHVLVAGSTGAGKSVGLNAMLMSLLCAKSPEDLRLVLIDPKRLEFGVYADIPHLLFPIVTSPSQVVPVLRWVVSHMEERYAVMAQAGARAIADYNNRVVADARYPYLVVVIDELADVMMTVGKDAEQLIARIAQMARAAGIHLIVATQRPSVDVITGIIKVNFPSRIAFRVTSRIDSRTILDGGGAEKLLGKGDMLFQDATSSTIKRVHGAYISDQEIATIMTHIRAQAKPNYINIQADSDQDGSSGLDKELMQQVVAFVETVDVISISLIQRVFKIGYNRSARIVAELETRGLILPQSSGKMRRVVKS